MSSKLTHDHPALCIPQRLHVFTLPANSKCGSLITIIKGAATVAVNLSINISV